MTPTVLDSYCRLYSVDESDFAADLLNRTLYPTARLLRPLLRLFDTHLFAEDLTFLDCIGRIRTAKQLRDETYDFRNLSANRRFSRRVLNLRVSVGRVHQIVKPLLVTDEATAPTRPAPAEASS